MSRAARSHPDAGSVVGYLEQLDKRSVFPEPHRVMVSDQVIRHRTADDASRALFLASYWHVQGRPAAVAWTDRGWFALERASNVVWDASSFAWVSRAGGELLLLASPAGSVYPYLGNAGDSSAELLGAWAPLLEPDTADQAASARS